MSEKMPPAQLKDSIRRGLFNDAKIREVIEEGRLTREELIKENVLSEDRLKRIFYISYDEHKKNIDNGKYTAEQIRNLIRDEQLRLEDLWNFHRMNIRRKAYSDAQIKEAIVLDRLDSYSLVTDGILEQDVLDDIFDVPLPLLDIGFESWDTIPPLLPDRVDVFVLGIVGSGKSAFMAGLLYYAKKIMGQLDVDIENLSGYTYVNALTDAVRNGKLPPRTPDEKMQYMACSFRSKQNETVPMTFVEMSGEVFQRAYARSVSDMPAKFVQYITHENSKVIIMAVDFRVHASGHNTNTSQESHFDYFIRFLDKQGMLKNTKAICILITKWDLSPDQSPEAAIKFLQEEYLNLYNLCMQMKEKYGLHFEIFRYSLGSFGRRNSYVYEQRDSALLYNWLCSFVPVQRTRKTGFIGKLFGK